ncbi:MAG: hypothetical protein L0Y74_07950 [candidate division Zixibacteria bacterium]|nr:hypothetical protein [candidate division Zixibacteria bacterium]
MSKIETYSISKRKSKVEISRLGKALPAEGNLKKATRLWFDSLPRILKAQDLNLLIDGIVSARRKKKGIIVMLGAHTVKCGLSPVLIDLMKRGYVTHLATIGAGAIHDLELAYWGKTSEEVSDGLRTGKFGMARETAEKFNSVSLSADRNRIGLGEALGRKIKAERAKYARLSLLATALELKIPASVHVALGTDIVHQHPGFDAASTAQASFRDFKILCHSVKSLANGGVVLNVGSAVLLPEVFLKALSVARNIYGRVENFTTANFDMIMQYRPLVNVVQRPTAESGRGFNFVGHHEIMIPLLAAGIKARGN